jgi:malate dehydrogenase
VLPYYLSDFITAPYNLTFVFQIVPLLSQSSPPLPAAADISALVNRIQYGGDEVVKAKEGAGSATLSMAYAGAEFAAKVLKALSGEAGIVTPSFVHLSADKGGGEALKKDIGADLDYFSSNISLGVKFPFLLRFPRRSDGSKL